jgi:hypothetical protein
MMFNVATHNGSVTINNPKTGQHRTFRIHTQYWGQNKEEKRVAQLLIGPDNTSDYQSFGFVVNGQVKVWQKYHGTVRETYAKMLSNPQAFEAKGAIYLSESKCRKCNRKLTDPTSIETGIGPVCAQNGLRS